MQLPLQLRAPQGTQRTDKRNRQRRDGAPVAAHQLQPAAGLRCPPQPRHYRRAGLSETAWHALCQRAARHHRPAGQTLDQRRQEPVLLRLHRQAQAAHRHARQHRRHPHHTAQRHQHFRGHGPPYLRHQDTAEPRGTHRKNTDTARRQPRHHGARQGAQHVDGCRKPILQARKRQQPVDRARQCAPREGHHHHQYGRNLRGHHQLRLVHIPSRLRHSRQSQAGTT